MRSSYKEYKVEATLVLLALSIFALLGIRLAAGFMGAGGAIP